MAVAWTQHRFSGGTAGARHHQHGRPARRSGALLRSLRRPGRDRPLRRGGRAFRGDELGGRRAFRRPMPTRLRRHGRRYRGRRPTGCSVGGRHRAAGSRPLHPAVPARLRGRARRQRELCRAPGTPFGEPARRSASRRRLRSRRCRCSHGDALQEGQDLSELQLAVPRQEPQFQPALVRHGGLRQPPKARRHYERRKTAEGECRCVERFVARR